MLYLFQMLVFKVFIGNGSVFQRLCLFEIFFFIFFITHIFSVYVTMNYSFQDNSKTLSHWKTVFMKPKRLSTVKAWRKNIPKHSSRKLTPMFRVLTSLRMFLLLPIGFPSNSLQFSSSLFFLQSPKNIYFYVHCSFRLSSHHCKLKLPYLHILRSHYP